MVGLYFAGDEVDKEGEKGEEEADGTEHEDADLVVGQISAFEVGDPVEVGHSGRIKINDMIGPFSVEKHI